MTRAYIDTEYNGLGGELISMAIVTDVGEEWYQVRQVPKRAGCDSWVWENVVPVLGQEAVGDKSFLASLEAFLKPLDRCRFIADWPADFEHLSACMTRIGAMSGYRMPIECTMRLLRSGDVQPVVPHNALSDARALKAWHEGHCAALRGEEAPKPMMPGEDLLFW